MPPGLLLVAGRLQPIQGAPAGTRQRDTGCRVIAPHGLALARVGKFPGAALYNSPPLTRTDLTGLPLSVVLAERRSRNTTV